jgi:hypothetical protein
LGLFSHLLERKVTPVTPVLRPHATEKVESNQRSNNGNTGNTEKTTMSARSGENAKQNYNNDSSKTAQKATPLARGLSSSGDTGVTSVTALKDNAFFGNTSFSECVTGVTVLKNKGNSAPSQVPELFSDAKKIAEVRFAVACGDPKLIEAAVVKYPDLRERAAIREFDGKFDRVAADWHALQDFLDEVERDD